MENEYSIELIDSLWKNSLNLHLKTDKEQMDFLNGLFLNRNKIGSRLLFKTLMNLLHVFFSHDNDHFTELFVKLFLTLEEDAGLNIGDVLENLGIISKGCNEEQKKRIFSYVLENVDIESQNASGIISICNCFRYMYPELSKNEKDCILQTLEQIKTVNREEHILASIDFTIKSLEE